ncbi:MAG: UDP-N-acetylmuramoyl-L-alanyl-D-glutamate--2,6-diaminopimelate ligase [bacterium]|nr:UDP-N-acetylmuramoyl-L-alanyl-D-glutamate--2,6-diaminopimelate ligase [bacterium]
MKSVIKKFIPLFLISWYHFLLAFLGVVMCGFPSRKIKVIGVTGTNGKTTTVEMINAILEEAGYKTAVLSSIRFKINDKAEINKLKMTMPGRFFAQKFLKRAVSADCKHAILEVTSEGVKQHRHRFINFEAAIFTNLTPEHIEAHKGFENYKRAKGEFFKSVKNIHVVNLEDKYAEYFLQFPAKKKYTYGLEKGDVNAQNTKLNLQLPGEFNIYNALAATCVGLSQGVSKEVCKTALEKIKGIPGRMELVIKEPFNVFVDYAFTPNALEQVYRSLTKNYKLKTNKLICVLGACGGGRDKWKRSVLGRIAKEYCDEIIITNEDPYDEDPMDIINQVAEGAGEESKKILDRREAISYAFKIAKSGDNVIITGKGSESCICVENGKKIPWDDREVVKEEFQKLNDVKSDVSF